MASGGGTADKRDSRVVSSSHRDEAFCRKQEIRVRGFRVIIKVNRKEGSEITNHRTRSLGHYFQSEVEFPRTFFNCTE